MQVKSDEKSNWFRNKNIYLTAYFIVVIAIQVIFACLLAYEPKYDVKSLYDGAVSLAETGKLTEELMKYFAWASNNFGFAFIMSVIIKIAGVIPIISLISKNYFLIFAFTNIILVNLGVYFLYDLIRRVCGVKVAYAVLAILFFYIPMYFFPSMIYTDTDTMWIPIVCINLFTRLRTESEDISKKKSTVFYILIGVISGLGFVIKPTAAIMFIAITIICCVFIRKSAVYTQIAISVALFIAVIVLFQIPYRIHVPKDIREENSIPYTHWVMMGLQNNGQGTWEEFAKTMSFPTYAEKNANAVTAIKERLNDMGVKGYVKLLGQKLGVLYSNPDLQPGGIIPFNSFDDNTSAAKLGDMRFNNTFYMVYNSIVFYGVVILAYASIFLRNRNYTAYLAMFGMHLFFVFWEVNPRWLTNYFFVLIFLACLSVVSLGQISKNNK